MKNILFNLQFVHFKNFLKNGKNSLSFTPVKCFSNSPFGWKALNDSDSKRENVPGFENIRCLNTSVKKFEKLTEIKKDQANKNTDSIIYSGSLTYRIKGVKVFTCTTSVGGIMIQPWMLQNLANGKDLPVGLALLSCVGFFTFVTPLLCHLITKKYVTEIRYNAATDTYTATVLSFFLQRININFKVEDITVPSIPPLFSTMCIKGRPVFIIPDSFHEVEHYIRMMGYDKPMDLKLNTVTNAVDKSPDTEK